MLKRYFNTTPIAFPIIGIALLIYFLYILVDVLSFQYSSWEYNLQILPLAIYTALWIGISFANRWAAIGFVVFTALMFTAYLITPNDAKIKTLVLSVLIKPLPMNLGLSLLTLIFYQKIDRKSREIKLKDLENH